MTILVADDDDSIRATCADILESAGYQVLQSSNGRDALAAAHMHKPDLILMDLMMPFMDGLTAWAYLQTDPVTQMIPVILMTAQSYPPPAGYPPHTAGFLPKPFTLDEFLNLIEQVLPPAHV